MKKLLIKLFLVFLDKAMPYIALFLTVVIPVIVTIIILALIENLTK